MHIAEPVICRRVAIECTEYIGMLAIGLEGIEQMHILLRILDI